ncbi:methionine--tRNA ligase [Komagataeibacter rhaeticus]|uniref:Methionine--tRNA ligase n=1 Tax=Komagataeibacter rhaeticus TaxID=215221 RepID=A0A181CBF8_9PROT|nr:methionine--tRNA ligase [Komagataeibacter rhaeticus]ATU72464.1 methionine--tRNA ligase [Komagataeibacter xylinus]EGG74793.1 Methionyl-tRNA synthetase [Gluconacetobacter sp. SXCC-1]KDU96957.1 methionine--tRNA ligase [Komagataeibacter rhaeticus AF1]MBL7238817.1 methionine--tRNA ligase [Komagataeibacter rhaeticus]PYD52937.1 methionine--tRNA ligase [Komagataeibacter rhaeticus]
MTRRYYVTTPIYYVNGAPHIGHAYTSVAADVIARFKRLAGFDVFFLTGTDEHGQKVEQAAQAAGMTPIAFADRVAADFRDMYDTMAISYDDFIRTTEPRHVQGAQALWKKLEENGHIYLDAYEGWYATRDECFYGEEELIDGPDGKKVAPTGAAVEWVKEPSYFFDLSRFGDRLLELYETRPGFIEPASRRNEVISFVKQGLRNLSVSRTSFSWGIPVPGDPKHVMYVWVDALANYLSAVGYPDAGAARWGFWPANLHLVGKDILRFHAIYWPALLMAAGLPLPDRVFSHGWWTIEGQKMSKSLGNVVDPRDLVTEFGLDPIRFFLMREMPFGGDSDLSRRAIISRMNVELANDLGNLAQRTLSQIARNCDGKLPPQGTHTPEDTKLLAPASLLVQIMHEQIDRQALTDALEEVWKLIRACNAYIDHQAPWKLKKTDAARMGDVLRVLADALRIIATVLQPYMPGSMDRMLTQLGVAEGERTFASLDVPLPAGRALPAPQGIFPRYVEPEAS